MAHLEREIHIETSPDAVYEVLWNLDRLHVWLPGIKQIESEPVTPQHGAEIHVVHEVAGAILHSTLRQIECVPHLQITGHTNGVITGNWKITCQPDDSGSLLSVIANYSISGDTSSLREGHNILETEFLANLDQALSNLSSILRIRSPLPRNEELIAREYLILKKEIDAAVQRVALSGRYTEDKEVAKLEEEFAEFCGVQYAVSTSSGTMALLIGLKALGIGPGDEVITTPYTCSTTAAISNSGARIRFADIDRNTLTLDPNRVEEKLTPNTRAILPVHLNGYISDMDPLMALAERYDLLVLEDAALATGATYHGRRAGSLGHVGAFSFASGKILDGIGSGGMITTSNPEVAARAIQLAGYGPDQPMDMPVLPHLTETIEGYATLLNSTAAASIRVKLPHLEGWLDKRRSIAKRFDNTCDRLGIRRLHPQKWVEPTPRSYIFFTNQREDFLQHLKKRGVRFGPDYLPPLHLRSAYSRLGYRRGDFPVAERAAEELICLAVHPQLTHIEVNRTIKALEDFS